MSDDQVGARLRGDIGHERMRAAWEARRERLPRDHGHLALMDASMAYLRQFVPVLAAVKFAAGPGMDDLLQAVAILAGLHASKARKVPDGAPGSFVPARWAGYLEKAAKDGDVGEDWPPRELRHTFVSIMSDNDVPIEKIADLVGHRTTIVTQTVYRHQLRPVIDTGATAMNAIFNRQGK